MSTMKDVIHNYVVVSWMSSKNNVRTHSNMFVPSVDHPLINFVRILLLHRAFYSDLLSFLILPEYIPVLQVDLYTIIVLRGNITVLSLR